MGEYSSNILRTSDSLGIHNTPNAKFEKWKINSHGFRGEEITLEKPVGVIRIVVMGASEVFGLYESEDMEFAAQMQTILDDVHPGKYQILNAASVGMTPPRVTKFYEAWIKNYSPDILIFYPTPSFYLDIDPILTEIKPADPLPKENHFPAFRLKRKLRTVLKQFIPEELQFYFKKFSIWRTVTKNGNGWVWESPPHKRLQSFSDHMNDLIHQVRKTGIELIILTHATRFSDNLSEDDLHHLTGWRKFFPRASESCLLEMEDRTNEIIKELGRNTSTRVIDIGKLVPKTKDNFADFAHFTDRGARLVASIIIKSLLKGHNENL